MEITIISVHTIIESEIFVTKLLKIQITRKEQEKKEWDKGEKNQSFQVGMGYFVGNVIRVLALNKKERKFISIQLKSSLKGHDNLCCIIYNLHLFCMICCNAFRGKFSWQQRAWSTKTVWKKNCMLQSFLTMDVIDLYSVKHHQKEVNSCQSSSKYR